MTDTFVVDDSGRFVVGKAQTTPADESEGFLRSADDALAQWGSDAATAFPQVASGIFSGTPVYTGEESPLLASEDSRVG